MILKIVNKSDNPTPTYATVDAAGMDLRANLGRSIELQPMERKLIPTGLFMEIEPGYQGEVRSRSGMALKQGVIVLNAPGTVDADFRGEVGVILMNLSDQPVTINHGDRIAQMVFMPYTKVESVVEVKTVEELTNTTRGEGGFGHTGVK